MQISGISSTLASTASKAASAVYDPRDTNQDGVVSAEEAFQYSLLHPEATSSTQATSGATGATASSGSINIYA